MPETIREQYGDTSLPPSEDILELMESIEAPRDVNWVTGWTAVKLSDARNDWLRFGRKTETERPGFSQIIVYDGVPVEHHTWRNLIDEEQLQTTLDRLT